METSNSQMQTPTRSHNIALSLAKMLLTLLLWAVVSVGLGFLELVFLVGPAGVQGSFDVAARQRTIILIPIGFVVWTFLCLGIEIALGRGLVKTIEK